MKEIVDVKETIESGSILTVFGNNGYCACLTRYDGRILEDVHEVKVGHFLEHLPNIREIIKIDRYLKVEYDFFQKEYQSAIVHQIKRGGYKEEFNEETIADFCIKGSNLEESLISLDTKIANNGKTNNNPVKQKIL